MSNVIFTYVNIFKWMCTCTTEELRMYYSIVWKSNNIYDNIICIHYYSLEIFTTVIQKLKSTLIFIIH